MDITIRPVQPDDARGIVQVLNPIIKTGLYTAFDTALSDAAERSYIQRFPDKGVFSVALSKKDERVVGFQSMEPFATFTHSFDHVAVAGTYVDLELRGRGIGTRLCEVCFLTAQAKGFEKIFSYVRADNPKSLAFYLKLGFRIVGTAQKHVKIGDRHIDEIIIEKLLL